VPLGGPDFGYAGEPGPLFEAARLTSLMDDGFISLDERSPADFIARRGQLGVLGAPQGNGPGRRVCQLSSGRRGADTPVRSEPRNEYVPGAGLRAASGTALGRPASGSVFAGHTW
jgi:hypothetical protein